MKNIIIAFSGKAMSGKSESAKALQEVIESTNDIRFTKLSFASSLKTIAQYYFGWLGDKGIYTKPSDDPMATKEIVQDQGRQLLINIGEKFREIRSTVWADLVMRDIKDLDVGNPENVVYCIDDLRFENEIRSLREYERAFFVRINRPVGQLNIDDPTEKDLDSHKFDYYIENDGTIKDLKQKIHQIYNEIIKHA